MYNEVRPGRMPGISAWDDRRHRKSFRRVTQVRGLRKLLATAVDKMLLTGDNWIDVTLDEFADCDSNLAANRMTRMLADLALVNCYNKTSMPRHERNRQLLASAKRNLAGSVDVTPVPR